MLFRRLWLWSLCLVAAQWSNSSRRTPQARPQATTPHGGRRRGGGEGSSDASRRLQTELRIQEEWEFPTGTRLGFLSALVSDAFGSGSLSAVSISVLAGYKYSTVQISMPVDYQFGIEHQEAIIKLVYSDATRGSCERADYNVPMALTRNSSTQLTKSASPLASGAVLRMPQGGTNALFQQVQWPHLTFMHGGFYVLCYSPDGSFFGDEWRNNLVPVVITVVGVASNCLSNGCLANERWDCYVAYAGEGLGSCRIDFRLYGGGRDGWTVQLAGTSRVSWTQAWGDDTFVDGVFTPAVRQECSNVITGDYISPETANYEDFLWAPPTGSGLDADASTAANLPSVRTNVTKGFTITACYCPNYDGPVDATLFACDHASEFIQPIGVIYYWMIRICDVETYSSCGSEGNLPFMRVLPQQPFVLRVECPPGGTSCAAATDNRVKFLPGIPPPGPDGVVYIEVPERAIWEPQSRCKIETSMTDDIAWEPPLQYDENGILINGLAHLIGGDRRDYKFWADPALLGLMPMESKVEVCYCESQCDNSFNYFKVGEITSTETAGIARWTKLPNQGGLIQEIESLQYVTKPGALTLYAGIRSTLSEGMHPYDSIPWRKKTTLKLVPYDNLANYPWGAGPGTSKVTLEQFLGLDRLNDPEARLTLNVACANGTFNAEYYNGPSSAELAREYLAWVGPGANQYLPFSGIENDQSFNTWKAGIFLVCYCAVLDADDLCASPNYYISAARLMFKGPLTDIQLNLPTSFVVRIDLEGWGFSDTDSIRLISMTQTCRENANDPRGVDVYRLGCPGLNSSSCRRPTEKEDISVHVISAEITGLHITEIEIGEVQSILTFSGDITAELLDGDAITLDESSILLSGRNSSQWTISEQHLVAKLSGFYSYADEPEVKRMLWNHVSYVTTTDEELITTLHRTKLSIPVGWPEGQRPEFSFVDNKGRWHRRNRLQTKEEIKVDEAATVKICWGAFDGGRQQYYGEAGVLEFSAPTFMADAGVYLTTRVQGGLGMAVLSFSPSRGTTFYKAYQVPVVVRLLFKEVDFMLEPLLSGEELSELEALPVEDQVLMENATQTICGKLFMEMWTNDDSGFPFPRGCYYGPLYDDVESQTEPARPSYREYFIIFEPQDGLKDTCRMTDGGGNTRDAPCVYQLALNVRVGEINMVNPREVVGIYTQCAGKSGYATACGPRYSVLEYGPAFAADSTMMPEVNITELERIELLPLDLARSLSHEGLQSDKAMELLGTSVQNGEDFLQFGLRAWPKVAQWPIERSGQLSIFFHPFTLWSLTENNYCLAICKAPSGLSCNDGRGGEFADCAVNPLVRTPFDNVFPMQRNVLMLSYPSQMDEIPPERFGEAHLLEISELKLPQEGFFTLRFMAQYLDSRGTNPVNALVSPPMQRVPQPGTTTGRIVMDGQTGNGPRPFIFERENLLIVRLRIGVTLRSAQSDRQEENETESLEEVPKVVPHPVVQIFLPPDYFCSVVGNGTADPDNSSDIFVRDLNNDGYVDNPMGTVLSGTWSHDGPICTFTLETSASVFAQQIFYVRLSVNNPRQALLRTDPTNLWRIRVAGMNSTTLGDLVNFISLDQEPNLPGWAGNLAVLTPLEGESLQPSNLSAGATNYLSVFFQVIHAMPEYSYILLDSPDGFDFTDNCSVSPLDDLYYQDWEGLPWGETVSGTRALTSSLGSDVNCTTDNWKRSVLSPPATRDFTRAIVRVGRAMLSNKYYGFQIRIQNALEWQAAHHDDWRLWVQSPEGYTVDGSKYTIQFNARRIDTLPQNYWDRSWGIYQDPIMLPLTMDFGQDLLLPSSVFDMSTVVTFFPLTPSADGALINMRVVAPNGYVWVPHEAGGWLGEVPGLTCEFCQLIVTPEVRLDNELILPVVVMRLGEEYGFQVRVRVPERPPTRSSNAFFLEMGFDPGIWNLDRMQAVNLPAPGLRVVSQAKIDSLCNLAGFAENIMEFHVHIASPLEPNAGFFFAGSENTRDTLLRCWPETLTPAQLNGDNGFCEVGENVVTGLPELKMYVVRGSFPSGLHIFRFRDVRNPLQPTAEMGSFSFGTYTDLHMYPKQKVLDLSKEIPVPRVLLLLPLTGLIQAPDYERPTYGRDDAPMRMNLITFYFQVADHPEVPDSVPYLYISLRGPAGFYFEEDCMENLQALNDSLDASQFPCSASNYPLQASWCPGVITTWPQNLEPEACLGIGHTARLSVPNPLARKWPGVVPNFLDNSMYAFKIQVQNPELQIEYGSQWAMDFVDFAGRPFDAFLVATFQQEETKLFLSSPLITRPWLQTTEQQYMTFRLDFRPYTTVPAPRMPRPGDAVPAARRMQISGLTPLAPDAEEGSLVVTVPPGFGFRAGDFDVCFQSSLERKERLLWDDEFFPSTEATCTVTGTGLRVLTYTLINQKPLLSMVTYSISSTVKNPDVASWPVAQDWLLETFKKFIATEQTIRLDSYAVPGTPMITPTRSFAVANLASEFTAGLEVPEMNVSFRLAEPLRNGDSIRLKAPPGFSLGHGECMNFRWSGTYRPLVYSPPPLCNCSNASTLCTMVLQVTESANFRAEVVPADVALSFLITVTNPTHQPALVENNWRMEFWMNQRLFSGSTVVSWPIYGLFQNLSVALVGTEQRAGAMSDLLFEFIPSVFGTALEIHLHEPLGFDFQVARVNAPWVRSDLTSSNRLLLIGGRLIPNEKTQVTLSLVRLGQGGGPTRISLRAYADAARTQETARRLNFLQGFRLPGAAMASNLRLWSERVVDHWSGQTQDSVSPLLPCHTNQLARFEIFVKVTRFILEGDALILTNSVPFGQAYWEPSTEAGYEPNMEMCLGSHGGVSSNGTWLCDGPVLPVNVTQQSVLRNSVGIGIGVELVLGAVRPQDVLSQASLDEVSGALQLEGDIGSRALAMEANRDYRLRIWLRASAAPTLWTIRTDDVRGFLSNTNDGLLPGVLAVPEMSITVTVMLSRTPPESSVWVRIHILTGPEQSQFSRLQLLLPYGFSPVGADADPTARLIVELSLEQGEGILDSVIGMTFNLRIQTPPQSIPDARWFVLAKQVIVDEITGEITEPVNGWAFANGFGVEPCPVTLMYGSIASATGWLALSFYVPRSVQGRFVLITETPTLLQSLQRTVNVTLVGGTEEGDNMLYMYLLNVLTPAEEPIYDPWQLRILDAGFYVVDAALNVPQPGFVPDLEMGNPSLSWLDPPQMGEVSNVQVEVSFLRRVKGVKAILVSLPENYRHDIQHKNQLRNVNKLFPLTIDEEWRVFDNLRYIKVLVEVVEVSNQAQIITSGTYQWQFPVMVPLIEPFASEWYVSLCAEPTCSAVGDPGILASFPVLNNEPQLPAKTFQVVAQTGQARTHRAPVWALMAVVGLFLMAHW
ncbi:unnamed protein product [Durusdinium trenchii]|uniref:Uncharacterized protein n=1 Tax=Durusdinium trenchii TaxID=1381693 RepID=A0ABP0PI01_9DINO